MENPNHQAGGWRPHYEQDSEEEQTSDEEEAVDTLAERLEETSV